MPTILITGAAGFVGGHVTREAARYRADLRLMSHRSPLLGSGPPTQEGPRPRGVLRAKTVLASYGPI